MQTKAAKKKNVFRWNAKRFMKKILVEEKKSV